MTITGNTAITTATAATGAAQTPREKQLAGLKKACEQFEAVFAKQLLGEMQKGSKSAFGDQPGGEIYKDMMDQSLADSISKRGALGIGQMLYKQFEKQVGGPAPIPAAPAAPASGETPTSPSSSKADAPLTGPISPRR